MSKIKFIAILGLLVIASIAADNVYAETRVAFHDSANERDNFCSVNTCLDSFMDTYTLYSRTPAVSFGCEIVGCDSFSNNTEVEVYVTNYVYSTTGVDLSTVTVNSILNVLDICNKPKTICTKVEQLKLGRYSVQSYYDSDVNPSPTPIKPGSDKGDI